MSTQGNKAMLRRMLHEVIVGGNLTLMDELVAPDFINHNVVGTGETSQALGVEDFRQEIRALRSAVPDIAIDEIHVLADGTTSSHMYEVEVPTRGSSGAFLQRASTWM